MPLMQFIFPCALMLSGIMLSAQVVAHTFMIREGSNLYDAKIEIKHCTVDKCSGFGKMSLYQKNTQKRVDAFESEDLNFYLDKNAKPTVNVVQLYGEYSPLIFNDFNFDGSEDLAIRNGNEGAYGGPSYDVYVYHKNKKEFIYSEDLASLTRENLGMFEVDSIKKRIMTRSKDGCCYHETLQYQVLPKKGLVLVEELIEDATSSVGGERVKVTERKLIQGKWKERNQYYPIDEYYK